MRIQNPVRCRQVVDADLPAIAILLARGFPHRRRDYWAAGLRRLAARSVPAPYPRIGYLLEHDGAPVGVLLLIVTVVSDGPTPDIRCNLSSWYVEPAFRGYAAQLGMQAMKHKAATYINISAAPNTWATIEAQGFVRYTRGQFVALPALRPLDRSLRVAPLPYDAAGLEGATLPEKRLLADHAALGCLSLVGTGPDGPHPFVFLPTRARQGRFWFPGMQLVYCRAREDFVRFAGPIGRLLLARGRPFVFLDTDGPIAGLPGFFLKDRARKYFKGPHAPRLGDLAYTEFTIFGA